MRTFSTFLVVFMVLGPALAHAEATSLDAAYKRELAFLEAERVALQERLIEVKRDEEQKVRAARSEIDRLQGRATSLSLEADGLEEVLAEVEMQAATQAETADLLDSTLQQAEVALSKGNVKLPDLGERPTPAQRLGQVELAFDKAVGLLGQYGRVRTEKGEFFDQKGVRVAGDIVRVGQIAAFGVSEKVAGALAPAGEGRLKVWPEAESAGAARAFASGQAPGTMGIFLFDSLDKDIEKSKEKTFRDLMKAGGPIGWVIVTLGVMALLLALIRLVLLSRAASNTERLVAEVAPLVKQSQMKLALERASASKSPVGRVLTTTLKNLKRPRDVLEDLISEAVMREQPAIDRFGSVILIAAAVGPLLGLLGTVTGMISTFDIITEYGNSNPKLLAGGISEALVTTELGLVVAIPCLLLGNLLGGWAQSIKDDIDAAALRITNVAHGDDVDELSGAAVGSVALAPAE